MDTNRVYSQLENLHFLIQECITNFTNGDVNDLLTDLEDILFLVEDVREEFIPN